MCTDLEGGFLVALHAANELPPNDYAKMLGHATDCESCRIDYNRAQAARAECLPPQEKNWKSTPALYRNNLVRWMFFWVTSAVGFLTDCFTGRLN
jgi:hypothetical protein